MTSHERLYFTNVRPESLKFGTDSQKVRFYRLGLDVMAHIHDIETNCVCSRSNGKLVMFTEGSIRKECQSISFSGTLLKRATKDPGMVFFEKLHQPGVP